MKPLNRLMLCLILLIVLVVLCLPKRADASPPQPQVSPLPQESPLAPIWAFGDLPQEQQQSAQPAPVEDGGISLLPLTGDTCPYDPGVLIMVGVGIGFVLVGFGVWIAVWQTKRVKRKRELEKLAGEYGEFAKAMGAVAEASKYSTPPFKYGDATSDGGSGRTYKPQEVKDATDN